MSQKVSTENIKISQGILNQHENNESIQGLLSNLPTV
uniref:Uncharacterized protein n=1 Tax=Anguilla anguilla TaxID=7936 RepID=A0A0E9PYB7_ANGAN